MVSDIPAGDGNIEKLFLRCIASKLVHSEGRHNPVSLDFLNKHNNMLYKYIYFYFQRILYLSTCSLYVQDMEEWGHLFPLLDYSRMVYVGSVQKEYNENSTEH